MPLGVKKQGFSENAVGDVDKSNGTSNGRFIQQDQKVLHAGSLCLLSSRTAEPLPRRIIGQETASRPKVAADRLACIQGDPCDARFLAPQQEVTEVKRSAPHPSFAVGVQANQLDLDRISTTSAGLLPCELCAITGGQDQVLTNDITNTCQS